MPPLEIPGRRGNAAPGRSGARGVRGVIAIAPGLGSASGRMAVALG